jgi:hypothetical protein
MVRYVYKMLPLDPIFSPVNESPFSLTPGLKLHIINL